VVRRIPPERERTLAVRDVARAPTSWCRTPSWKCDFGSTGGEPDLSVPNYLRAGSGSTAAPRTRTSKCRCGPVASPVAPTRPTSSPVRTDSPTWTSIRERCAYIDRTPRPWAMTTSFPQPPAMTPAQATRPDAAAVTGVPRPGAESGASLPAGYRLGLHPGALLQTGHCLLGGRPFESVDRAHIQALPNEANLQSCHSSTPHGLRETSGDKCDHRQRQYDVKEAPGHSALRYRRRRRRS